jgi:hypothetical protein
VRTRDAVNGRDEKGRTTLRQKLISKFKVSISGRLLGISEIICKEESFKLPINMI